MPCSPPNRKPSMMPWAIEAGAGVWEGVKPGQRLRGEAITFAPDRMNVLRVLLIVFQLLPQPRHMHINRPRTHIALILPHVLQQFFPRYSLAPPVHQIT